MRETLQRIPEIANNLGPTLEGRDQEEIDQLVDYTRQQMQNLPDTLQQKVIGKIQTPMSYNRKALRDIRSDLDELVTKASHFQVDRIDRVLHGTVVTMAFWLFLVIIMAILIATGTVLSGGRGSLNVILILVMALLGFAWLPIRGWILKSNYRQRMNELHKRYNDTLERAGQNQIKYGTQLRRDVTSPFTRLITTQTEQSEALKKQLEAHEGTLIGLQQKLSGLLKD